MAPRRAAHGHARRRNAEHPHDAVILRGPGGAPTDGSSALHYPGPVSSTATRACDSASDVPSHDPLRTRLTTSPHRLESPGPTPPPSRQRRRGRRTRTPSIAECSLPRSRPPALAVGAWDHGEPATGVAARMLVAFATATRLPARVHPLSSPASPRRSQGARPEAFRPWTKRRSSTSATNTTREHDRGTARPPSRVQEQNQRALARVLASLPGVAFASPATPSCLASSLRARSASSRTAQTRLAACIEPRRTGPKPTLPRRQHRPRFHGSGTARPSPAGVFCSPAPLRVV